MLLLLLGGCSGGRRRLGLSMLLSGEIGMLTGVMAGLLLMQPGGFLTVLVLVGEDVLRLQHCGGM